jgi:hypothetical protein
VREISGSYINGEELNIVQNRLRDRLQIFFFKTKTVGGSPQHSISKLICTKIQC